MQTSRFIAALALSIACATTACVQPPETSAEPPVTAAEAAEEEPTGTSEQAVETVCLEACMDAWDRLNAICRTLPQIKRQACWIAANGVLATCIANCPD
jgi:hypothetical protein